MTEPARCHARSKQSGKPCKQPALPGQKVCRFHGGSSPQALAKAEVRITRERALGQVGQLLEELGEEPVPDPLTGLEHAYALSARMLAATGILVAQLDSPLGFNRHDEQVIHPIVALHGEWHDRHVRTQKLALDAGIDERRLNMAERDARTLLDAVGKAIEAAALTADQQGRFRSELATRLRDLNAGEAG